MVLVQLELETYSTYLFRSRDDDILCSSIKFLIVKLNEQYTTKLCAGNVSIILLKKEEKSNPLITGTSSRNYERHWTAVHLDVKVSEIEKKVALVKHFGGVIEGSESGDWGTVEYCSDPSGNGFCLCQING